MIEVLRKKIFDAIVGEAFVAGTERYIHDSNNAPQRWLFDFRKIILRPDILDAYATLFIETHKQKLPFQVAGLEVAAIPLVTAIVLKSVGTHSPINGFFIRKSRKKSGLLNMVEGTVRNEPVILVDDILNSGSTFLRQIAVIDDLRNTLGYSALRVDTLSAILRFKPETSYTPISSNNICIQAFFDLDTLKDVLPVRNITGVQKPVPINRYKPLWRWRGPEPRLEYVLPKAAPLIVEDTLYTTDDTGRIVALDPQTGVTRWEYRVPIFTKRRTAAFATPVSTADTVFFGSPDGNIYALDAHTGTRRWVYFDGDWVESDLSIHSDGKILFAVCDYGTFKKHSSVVALDTQTGFTLWRFTPTTKQKITSLRTIEPTSIAVGTTEGNLIMLDRQNGAARWETTLPLSFIAPPTYAPTENALLVTGLPKHNTLHDIGTLYVLNVRNGSVLGSYSDFAYGSYGAPLVYKHLIIFSSLDKHVYAIDSKTLTQQWSLYTGARIFASPTLHTIDGVDRLLVGSNNGVLYEITPETGEVTSQTFVTERITSRVTHDPRTNIVFLPTYANELYALIRESDHP